ncbi:anti-sigma factor [Actinoplanes sp. CA-030573]|uniref:anti-sigma factor n=1 Tax=Actinoplanes sp. CA-030573 TaxID=3239898 RepID=UPI003D8CBE64
MPHLDPDRLVLLALFEQAEDLAEAGHLAGCAPCRQEIDALRTVAVVGAETQDLRDLPPPPERIWRRIQYGVSRPTEPAAPPAVPSAAASSLPASSVPASVAPASVAAAGAPGRSRRRSRRGWLVPVLAAAVAAVLAVTGTLAVDRFLRRPPPERVTARAVLAPLPEVPPSAAGTVRVLSDGEMRIDVRNLPLTTGFHEVWLIDPDDLTKMVSLGNLTDRPEALLPVPPGVDMNRYRLVDVSDEPHDGDAAHSGHSLLRGTLTK